MAVFNVGDRVRVLATSDTGSYADRMGAVAWVDRNADGAVLAHHVRLDGDSADRATIVYVAFRPGELEPEEGGAS